MKIKFLKLKFYFSKAILVNVVHVLEVFDLHDVGFQSLLEDFFQDGVSVTVVVDSHSLEAVVVETEKCAAGDVMLKVKMVMLGKVLVGSIAL